MNIRRFFLIPSLLLCPPAYAASAPMTSLPVGTWQSVTPTATITLISDGKTMWMSSETVGPNGQTISGDGVPSMFAFNPDGSCVLDDGRLTATCQDDTIHIQGREINDKRLTIDLEETYRFLGDTLTIHTERTTAIMHEDGTRKVDHDRQSLKLKKIR